MKTSALVVALCISGMLMGAQAQTVTTTSREYSLKAAFLCNFVVFTDWPKEAFPDSNDPVVIGIIGKDPFADAFDPIKNRPIKNRKIQVMHFRGIKELKQSDKADFDKTREAVRKCHLLFICQSENSVLNDALDMVKGASVMTVADMPDFLESGGMINLFMEDMKIRFEINNTTINEARLKCASQLLRLAKRVIGQKTSEADTKQ